MTLVTVLEEGRQDVISSVAELSDAQAAAKPAPDRWSPLDCLEHLVIVEERFLGWVANGTVIESPQVSGEKEASLASVILDRSSPVKAPEAVVPSSRYTTVAEGLAAFNRVRDLSVRIAQERGEALYGVGVKHPRFGDMNAAELLVLMSGHGRRHAAQIREAVG